MLYNIVQQLCKVYFGYNFHGVLSSPRSHIICQRKILSEKPETLMAFERKTAENDPAALSKFSYMPRRPTREAVDRIFRGRVTSKKTALERSSPDVSNVSDFINQNLKYLRLH